MAWEYGLVREGLPNMYEALSSTAGIINDDTLPKRNNTYKPEIPDLRVNKQIIKTKEICSSRPISDEVRIRSLMILISFTKQEKQVCCCQSNAFSPVRVNYDICHSQLQLST